MLVLLYFFPFKILVIFVSDIFLKNVASGKKLWMRILTACLPWYYQWPESPKWVLRKGRGQLDRLCERQSAASQRSKSGFWRALTHNRAFAVACIAYLIYLHWAMTSWFCMPWENIAFLWRTFFCSPENADMPWLRSWAFITGFIIFAIIKKLLLPLLSSPECSSSTSLWAWSWS